MTAIDTGAKNSNLQMILILSDTQTWLYFISGIIGIFYVLVPLIILQRLKDLPSLTPLSKKLFFLINSLCIITGVTILTSSFYILSDTQKAMSILGTFFFLCMCAAFLLLLLILLSVPDMKKLFILKEPKDKINDSGEKYVKKENAEKINDDIRVKESEERFRWLVESSPNAIILTDESGSIRLVNRQTERLFGYERNELIGKQIEILMPERYRKHHITYRSGYYNDPQTRPMGTGRDLYGLHKLGNEIPIEIGLTPLRMKEKLAVLATIVDITERKRNEENILQKNIELAKYNEELKTRTAQLIQSEKMSALGTLVAGVAHELNNPITGILNYTQYCRRNVEQDSKIAAVLDDIIYETKRCEEIVKNLLQYSHPYESREKISIDFNMLEQIIRRASTLFSHELKKINLNLYLDKDFSGFRFEKNKLQQIISNLMKNSIDAMETSSTKQINIRAFNDNSHCYLVFEDTGSGIDEENITRIFDPFFTTKDVGKGTGLGLTVIKGIVEESKGEISVTSVKNKGTKFQLMFPGE